RGRAGFVSGPPIRPHARRSGIIGLRGWAEIADRQGSHAVHRRSVHSLAATTGVLTADCSASFPSLMRTFGRMNPHRGRNGVFASGLSRRAFVRAIGRVGASLVAAPLLTGLAATGGRSWAAGDPFSIGVAAGDPSADGFVLWTRLAPEPL